ncbi:metallophosphoesterase family protein [Agrobacterium larrymoorei]|uniref:Metallophosphoesterase n=1 Tax=Agrobacterium larrymoorei TaxID=160699 RepID=A0A4D7DSL2_9HYPH|nr:metallophosphoesterase [Agrobacterium larrymoorei]QCI97262.1 metallophosphoesterase [Agrobacterium larrymoorei]QYA07304.1 metallophosphoesterase [Agrobacterium larrymoorei]WHA41954.1 metallophosphoesterase [Agrobacterium larrymoorei]
MFKLAHISDIHLGPLPKLTFRELASKRITGFVNWRLNRRKHLFTDTLEKLLDDMESKVPDHTAITGDLVNLATGIEIRAAADWLEEVGDPLKVSVVPGNHDAYVPGAHDKAMAAWYPYVRGDGDEDHWDEDRKIFPYMRVRGPVALIGCSTSIATPPFSATGYFGRRQARATADLLKKAGEQGLFRVVMIHHPPIRGAAATHKRMIGIRRFAAAMGTGGAELVLHGHTHLNTVYWLNTHRGQDHIPVVGIASASQGPGGAKPRAGYNLFHISGSPGSWNVTCERFSLNEKATGMELEDVRVFYDNGRPLGFGNPVEQAPEE